MDTQRVRTSSGAYGATHSALEIDNDDEETIKWPCSKVESVERGGTSSSCSVTSCG